MAADPDKATICNLRRRAKYIVQTTITPTTSTQTTVLLQGFDFFVSFTAIVDSMTQQLLSFCAMNYEVFTDYIASSAFTPRVETEGDNI